jgi:hypothetical protein
MRTRLIRIAIAAVALAVPAVSTPAQADVAVAFGTGWIDPGINTPDGPCIDKPHFEITGQAANLGTTYATGPYDFLVIGDSTQCASFTSDTGAATIQGDVVGSLQYTRTVGLISLNGFASVDGAPSAPISITCHVAILDAQPVRNFAVVCAVTI